MMQHSFVYPDFNTPVVVLAGGLGTRLKSTIGDMPKPLAPVGHKPFLEILLDDIETQGFFEVILSCGYLSQHIEHFADKYRLKTNLKIRIVIEPNLCGTGGALQYVLDSLGLVGGFFVCNGDTYVPLGLKTLKSSIDSQDAYMGLVFIDDVNRYGSVKCDQGNRITQFSEKGLSGPGLINSGLYYFHTDFFKADIPSSLESDVFPKWLAQKKIKGIPLSSSFIDIGVPSDYNRFCLTHSEGLR